MSTGSAQDQLLAQQRAYYRALAPDYRDQNPASALGFWLSHVPGAPGANRRAVNPG